MDNDVSKHCSSHLQSCTPVELSGLQSIPQAPTNGATPILGLSPLRDMFSMFRRRRRWEWLPSLLPRPYLNLRDVSYYVQRIDPAHEERGDQTAWPQQ